TYINDDIWRIRNDQTSKRQFFIIRIFRIFVLAIRRFFTDDCMIKASALTYYSLLSVVPMAALAFAIANGFGFREGLETELQNKLAGHEEVFIWIKGFALDYLDNTKKGAIAGVGVAVLLWSIMKILGNIERSFNDIWDVKHARSFFRKFTNYLSFMIVATILLVASSGFMVFITGKIEVFYLGKIATPIINWAAPIIMTWTVFTLMFLVMPNTKVKAGPAIFGGIFAGTFFLLLQFVYITFQVGVSKYNAIYGSFAAIPLFLVWMRSSWLIVLLGAELSYAAQYEKSYEFEVETKNMSYYYRRLVSLMLVKLSVDRFKTALPAPTSSEFSLSLKLPSRMVSELLRRLVESEVLTKVVPSNDEEDVRYSPAFDINEMTVSRVVEKLEKLGVSDFHFAETDEYQKFYRVFDAFRKELEASDENRLIRDI
ncbi:MAG TPA: YihY/virulence factor BrkB family protein, partial [Marinilabiliaceae bacterium]|nr:YihY/virulence factor BrkB family protein [Marinilabiliaceae bacterium]